VSTPALWAGIAATTVAIALLRATGPLLLGGRRLPRRLLAVTALAAPALLAGLVVVEVGGHGLTIDTVALTAGLAVAATVYLLRAPIIVAVGAAMLVTALLRWWIG
jgi:hypothetical protein